MGLLSCPAPGHAWPRYWMRLHEVHRIPGRESTGRETHPVEVIARNDPPTPL
jgi:hypothetical protein